MGQQPQSLTKEEIAAAREGRLDVQLGREPVSLSKDEHKGCTRRKARQKVLEEKFKQKR